MAERLDFNDVHNLAARVARIESHLKLADLVSVATKPETTNRSPFTEAAQRSPSVSKTSDPQSGLRTERVTLEVVHGAIASVNDQRWWDNRLWIEPQKGESVRVVSDEEREAPPTTKTATTENDYVPPAPTSRPAETRQTQAERVGGGWWFPKCDKPSAPPPPPPAPPRVHRGSGVFDASGDEVPWEGVVAMLTDERDAAIRERDAAKARVAELEAARITQSLTADRFASAVAEADSLRARVAELEPKLAPDANDDGESNHAAQAASGGGEGEPVAWGIANPRYTDFGNCEVWTVRQTEEIAKAVYLAADGWQHFPLYRQPPQPRGWLSEEERESIDRATHGVEMFDGVSALTKALRSLLARSSPPEVVHPECHFDQFSGCSAVHAWNICAADFRKALAAAGVAVKEVPE